MKNKIIPLLLMVAWLGGWCLGQVCARAQDLHLLVSSPRVRAGDIFSVTLSGTLNDPMDIYGALLFPWGELYFFGPQGLSKELLPFRTSFLLDGHPLSFLSQFFIPHGIPEGTYTFLAAPSPAGKQQFPLGILEARVKVIGSETLALAPDDIFMHYALESPAPEFIKKTGASVAIRGSLAPQVVEELRQEHLKIIPLWPGLYAVSMNDVDWYKQEFNLDLKEDYPCRQIDGSPVPSRQVLRVCRTLFKEKHKALLKQLLKQFILKEGLAGLMLDELTLYSTKPDYNMDDQTMEAFRQWLLNSLSAKEIQTIGIEDISTFNYRAYLQNANASSVWQDPNPHLRFLFRLFLLKEAQVDLADIVSFIRAQKEPPFTLAGNAYFLTPESQVFIKDVDLLCFEAGLFKEGAFRSNTGIENDLLPTSYLRLAHALAPKKLAVISPSIFDLAYLEDHHDEALLPLLIAEAFAAGAHFLLPYQAYTSNGRFSFSAKAEDIAPYTQFSMFHRHLFEKGQFLREIGVVFDWEKALAYPDYLIRFLELLSELERAHYNFGVLYCGKAGFIDQFSSPQEGASYRALITENTGSACNKELADNASKLIAVENYGPQNVQVIKEEVGPPWLDLQDESVSAFLYRREDGYLLVLVNRDYQRETHQVIPKQGLKLSFNPEGLNLKVDKITFKKPGYWWQDLPYTTETRAVSFEIPRLKVLGVVKITLKNP